MRSSTSTRGHSVRMLRAGALALVVMGALACSGNSTPPPELQGTWSTEYPDYADRGFAITDSSVTFFQGEGRSSVHLLVGVESEDRPGRVMYTLQYDLDGTTVGFSFEYTEPGRIRLENQEHMLWERES